MPSASETIAMPETKGARSSVRMASVRLRIKALDEPGSCGVYRLGRHRSASPRAFAAMGKRGASAADTKPLILCHLRISLAGSLRSKILPDTIPSAIRHRSADRAAARLAGAFDRAYAG